MQGKMTKTNQVREHLRTHGSITQWQAIEMFKATRLSAIVFNLKQDGLKIKTENVTEKDCNGNSCTFAKYIYLGEENG